MSEWKITCPICDEPWTVECDVNAHPNDMYYISGCEHVGINRCGTKEVTKEFAEEVATEYKDLQAKVDKLELEIRLMKGYNEDLAVGNAQFKVQLAESEARLAAIVKFGKENPGCGFTCAEMADKKETD